MTLYFHNPEAFANRRRWMMHKLLENQMDVEQTLPVRMEMKSNKDELIFTALLPGVPVEQVDIQFNNGILSVNGDLEQVREEGYEYLFSDIPFGKFSRSIEIKEPVVADKISASMKDGILTIHVPRAEEAKPKSIKIVAR